MEALPPENQPHCNTLEPPSEDGGRVRRCPKEGEQPPALRVVQELLLKAPLRLLKHHNGGLKATSSPSSKPLCWGCGGTGKWGRTLPVRGRQDVGGPCRDSLGQTKGVLQ